MSEITLNISTTNDTSLTTNVFPPNFNFVDVPAKQVAEYLMKNLNTTFESATNGYKVVKTYRTFNDQFIPLTDMPCLKIYRTRQSSYFENSPISTCRYTCNYIIVPNRKKVSDINIYVAEEILRLLIDSKFEDTCFTVSDESTLAIDFETFITPDNIVMEYSTISFSLFSELGNYFECS